MANSLMIIKPYFDKDYECWVFDDEHTGLVKEALVAGVPEIIEGMCQLHGIPMESAKQGFRMIFSEIPFPGWQLHAKHHSADVGDGKEGFGSDQQLGNWFEVVAMLGPDGQPHPAATGHKGWLCPALFKYFDHTPQNLYAKAEEIKR